MPRQTTASISPKAYLTLTQGRGARWREKVTMWLSGLSLGLQKNPQVQGKKREGFGAGQTDGLCRRNAGRLLRGAREGAVLTTLV